MGVCGDFVVKSIGITRSAPRRARAARPNSADFSNEPWALPTSSTVLCVKSRTKKPKQSNRLKTGKERTAATLS